MVAIFAICVELHKPKSMVCIILCEETFKKIAGCGLCLRLFVGI